MEHVSDMIIELLLVFLEHRNDEVAFSVVQEGGSFRVLWDRWRLADQFEGSQVEDAHVVHEEV